MDTVLFATTSCRNSADDLSVAVAGIRIGKKDITTVNRRLHSNNMGRTMQKQEHKDYAKILHMKFKQG